MIFHHTDKAKTSHRNVPHVLFVARTTTAKAIFDWKHALERLRSHEHSMEHIDATITFSRRCN